MDKSEFLSVALEAATQAEKVIMKYYAENLVWQKKSDLSPVSVADIEAEKVIIETIKNYFPEHSILSEESGSNNLSSKYQWVIDPIDGTKNYIRKIPLFATQIALQEEGKIILGVSNAPAMNELIFAERGKGAFLAENKISTSSVQSLADSYLCFGGIKHFKKYGYIDSLLNLVDKTNGYRGIGDAWPFHLLAQGKIDIVVEAQVKLWDIAALKIIIEESGGKVTDIEGKEITKDSTSIVATNKHLHSAVLEVLRN